MIQYNITGSLYPGVPWEDCFSPVGPNVSIRVVGEPDANIIPAGQNFIIVYGDDNWIDVTVHELTEKVAKTILAEINKVTPAEIKITQQGVCMSV